MTDDYNNDMRFNELFAELIYEMSGTDTQEVSRIEQILIEISLMFRLSKGVTRVYRNPREEMMGVGETMCCFDLHKEDELVHHVRIVSSIMTIVTMDVYMTPDTDPLNEDELRKVDLVMRSTVSYISRNRLRSLVEELSFTDDSGYPNLRSIRHYLDGKLGVGKMDGMVGLYYNLRHFGLINQEIGRVAGDMVMNSHFAGLTKIIGEDGRTFRLGGDNFIAFFRKENLDPILEYLTETNVRYESAETPVIVSSSVGVFVIPDGMVIHDQGEVLEKILVTGHSAQSSGGENIVYFSEEILARKERISRVQKLFPEALRNEEFKVFYQPKVNTDTGELCGAEALCRWFRDGEVIPPMDFIPALEQTIDICRLDLYMLEHVCKDIRRWLDEGRKVVRISVNLSRKHMMNADLLGTITNIIDSVGIPHRYIEIELTETTTDIEFNALKRVVGGLQQEGVYTSVDDFGIGYSSLNLIRDIPWDVLKVDRSFLPVEKDDPYSTRSVMFKHVVAMARELGLECVAEGVETHRQLKVLRENNCNLAQGFLFDKPLPLEEFESRLDNPEYPCYI